MAIEDDAPAETSVPEGPLQVVQRSGRFIALGADWWEIRDDGAPVQFVDIISEGRHENGVVYLAFGSKIMDANNTGIVNVASRIRLNLSTAQDLRRLLTHIIDDALKPIDKSSSN